LAEIAVALQQALARRRRAGSIGRATPRIIAEGDGWSIADVICTSGPADPTFEEQHARVSIALVLAGSFQYRAALGREVMTPGSAMLGNAAQCYECSHDHAAGDRCIAFWFEPAYFEQLAADAGVKTALFTTPRLPAVRELSPLVAEAAAQLLRPDDAEWEELSIRTAMKSLQLAGDARRCSPRPGTNAEGRITKALRLIEARAAGVLTLRDLADEADMSPFHFLRTFEGVTGVTPHQYLRRTRLRHAAVRLAATPHRVIDVALDSGFGDVSNFNRAFRAEFRGTPKTYRRSVAADERE
jgi:AraC family transcriptional regulator